MATAQPDLRLAEIDDLVCWYPQFGDDYETARPGFRQKVLDTTSCIFSDCPDLWGCRILEAHVHAAAHVLIVNSRATSGDTNGGGDKGRILSMAMGPVNVSFEGSTATGFNGEWSSTSAGQRFLQIQDEIGPVSFAPGGRGCDDDGFVGFGGFCGC